MLFVLKQLGWRWVASALANILAGVVALIGYGLLSATSASGATITAWWFVWFFFWIYSYLLIFEWLEDAGRVRSIGDIYRRIRTGLWPR